MPKTVRCQNCQGNGKIYQETKPGKWEWKTCPACGGTGKTTVSLI